MITREQVKELRKKREWPEYDEAGIRFDEALDTIELQYLQIDELRQSTAEMWRLRKENKLLRAVAEAAEEVIEHEHHQHCNNSTQILDLMESLAALNSSESPKGSKE